MTSANTHLTYRDVRPVVMPDTITSRRTSTARSSFRHGSTGRRVGSTTLPTRPISSGSTCRSSKRPPGNKTSTSI